MAKPQRELQEHEAYGLLLLISLVWAGNFMAGKLALEVVGPITLTALRAVLASGVLLWYVRWSYPVWPVATAAASHACARASNEPNFKSVLQATHGTGVRPARYSAANSSMTARSNSRSVLRR